MVERLKLKFPPIPGVPREGIRDCDATKVLLEIHRLLLAEGDYRKEIAQIFDASPEPIQKAIRIKPRGSRYETY